MAVLYLKLKDAPHNPGEAVTVGLGWAARRFLQASGMAFGKKSNAADRSSSADHRPQGLCSVSLGIADVV